MIERTGSDKDPRAALEELANALQVFVLVLDAGRQRAPRCRCLEGADLHAAAERSMAAARHLRLALGACPRKENTLLDGLLDTIHSHEKTS